MGGSGAVAEVPAAAEGERLDRFVSLVTGCSRSEASRAVSAGKVLLDGSPVTKASARLARGQIVSLRSDPGPVRERVCADEDVAFGVVHADSSLIVVDKPAGLVVHPAPGHPDRTLCNGLLARFSDVGEVGDPARPGIVHRLDRMTSGLLVVARTPEAHRSLVVQLADHSVDRAYTAVVLGHPEANAGVVDAPIGRSRRNPLRMTVAAGAKDARTHFEVQESFEDPECALLGCRLETGRTHQIRVHMATIGHPVAGDELYGGERPGLGLPRMFLHASSLGFVHPATGGHVRYTSPLPADLAEWLAVLRTARGDPPRSSVAGPPA